MTLSPQTASERTQRLAEPADTNPDWDLLTSALASDALDTLGLRNQCLSPDIRPLALSHRVVGRAYPALAVASPDPEPARPYEKLLEALDTIKPGSVFVFDTQRSDAAGVWGELVTTACLAGGIAGALTDGLIRDVTRVLGLSFPVFSRGATPYDSKGRVDVIEHGKPVVMGGVRISEGDVVVADADGVCIIPVAVEADVLTLVREKTAGESEFRQAVKHGMRVTEAFRKFKIL
ncbi:RraA family protein [Mycobacterium sp. DSM 3803]|nr:RraA family protein [Mycobacterium sp. DSM 3803]